jgi:hypothetical protein
LVEAFRVPCQSILGLVRASQHLQNALALRLRTKRQIGSPHAGQQPVHGLADRILRAGWMKKKGVYAWLVSRRSM